MLNRHQNRHQMKTHTAGIASPTTDVEVPDMTRCTLVTFLLLVFGCSSYNAVGPFVTDVALLPDGRLQLTRCTDVPSTRTYGKCETITKPAPQAGGATGTK